MSPNSSPLLARVGAAKDVRDAVDIAIDRDSAREILWVCKRLRRTEKQRHKCQR